MRILQSESQHIVGLFILSLIVENDSLVDASLNESGIVFNALIIEINSLLVVFLFLSENSFVIETIQVVRGDPQSMVEFFVAFFSFSEFAQGQSLIIKEVGVFRIVLVVLIRVFV